MDVPEIEEKLIYDLINEGANAKVVALPWNSSSSTTPNGCLSTSNAYELHIYL